MGENEKVVTDSSMNMTSGRIPSFAVILESQDMDSKLLKDNDIDNGIKQDSAKNEKTDKQ